MDSTFVIKAKYGETLRRFNARVNEGRQLDLSMSGLRFKIIGLFNFPLDADLTLTYVDEDGDVVALVDDDDLCDVMKQRLKFLRVDVKLNNNKSGKYARSSGTSSPLSSPGIPNPLPNINASVAEVLKTVPEPLCGALSKLSLDIASKAASSSLVCAELFESISNLSQSFINNSSQSQVDEAAGCQTATPDVSVTPSVPSVPVAESNSGMQEVVPKSNSTSGNRQDAVVTAEAHSPDSVDLKVQPAQASNCATGDATETKKQGASIPSGALPKLDGFFCRIDPSGPWCSKSHFAFNGMPMANDSVVPPHMNISKRNRSDKDAMVGIFHTGVRCDGCGAHPIVGLRYKSLVKEDYDLCSVCFTKMGKDADYLKIEKPMTYIYPHSSRGPRHLHHWGPPLLSPPTTSWGTKPEKCELDSRFIRDVNVFDGTVMPPSTPFTKIWRMQNSGPAWPRGTRLVWLGGDRFSRADFVELQIPVDGMPPSRELDVAVDFISPELPGQYVSYWRMASPSGKKFGQRIWVLIQVDASLKEPLFGGCHGFNLNVPPESSGAGNLIKPMNRPPISDTVNPMADGHPNKIRELSLLMNDASIVAHGVSGADPVPSAPISPPVPVQALSYVPLAPTPLPEQVTSPASLISSFAPPISVPAPPTVSPPPLPAHFPAYGSYPIILSHPRPVTETSATSSDNISVRAPSSDWSEVAQAGLPKPVTSTDVSTSSGNIDVDDAMEKSLLRDLDDMGFKHVDLNKKVLRDSGYKLEESVDALCGFCEWDPILEELQEMGFTDKERNKQLLENNNGSIKLVVLDLLKGEKEA